MQLHGDERRVVHHDGRMASTFAFNATSPSAMIRTSSCVLSATMSKYRFMSALASSILAANEDSRVSKRDSRVSKRDSRVSKRESRLSKRESRLAKRDATLSKRHSRKSQPGSR